MSDQIIIDYDLGIADFEGRIKVGWLQALVQGKRIGVKTDKPWVYLSLAVACARKRLGLQADTTPVPYAELSEAEIAAVGFLHQTLVRGQSFLFDVVGTDDDETNLSVFADGTVFLSASQPSGPVTREDVEALSAEKNGGVNNPVAVGADIVKRFVDAYPASPIQPLDA